MRATERAPRAISIPSGLRRSLLASGYYRPRSPGAALPDRSAVSVCAAGFDADAVALGNRPTGRAHRRSDRAHRADAADRRHRRRRRHLLPQSRHRPRRAPRGHGRGRRASATRAADPPSPSRPPRTCSCGPGAASCAKCSKCRWRCGSTWCCRSAGCWKFTSISPSGVQTASSAPKPALAGPSANRHAIDAARSGRTCRHPAEPGPPQRADAERPGAPACRPSMSTGPQRTRRSTPASATAPPPPSFSRGHSSISAPIPSTGTCTRRATSWPFRSEKHHRRRRGMRRSADALKRPTYVEDKDSGELRRPHHIDLKTGMYRGRQVLNKKAEA